MWGIYENCIVEYKMNKIYFEFYLIMYFTIDFVMWIYIIIAPSLMGLEIQM